MANACEEVDKTEPLCMAGRKQIGTLLQKTVWSYVKNLKNRTKI